LLGTAPLLALLYATATVAADEDGAALFRANCAECHQISGQGIRNVYPALAGSETVLGSGLDVALVMIIGRGEMPSFDGVLDSAEMAAIINYVRSSWGNSGDPVSAEQVEQLH
jgi:mono/diheme cytochrome c family protein